MYLVGKNIKLVKFSKDNITDEYISWLNDDGVNKFLHTGRIPLNKEEISLHQDSSNLLFAIMAKKIDSSGHIKNDSDFSIHIGNISLHNIDWIIRKGEVGYIIGNEKYWNRGMATEAVGLVKEYGLKRLNLHKLYAGVVEGNIGSDKVLTKNGFKRYGTIPEEYVLDGKYVGIGSYYVLQSWC